MIPDSLYVDPENIDDLAEAINHILSDKKLKDNIIKKDYEYALNFREEKVAEDLMEVYRQVLE